MIREDNRTDQKSTDSAISSAFQEIFSKWQGEYVAKLSKIHRLRYEARAYKTDTDKETRAFLETLLETLDSYDKMLSDIGQALPDDEKKAKRVLKSFEILRKKFNVVLKQFGVVPVAIGDGEIIPGLHKAIGVTYTLDVPEGHVVYVEQQGYHWKNQILRPAEVVIASSKIEDSEE